MLIVATTSTEQGKGANKPSSPRQTFPSLTVWLEQGGKNRRRGKNENDDDDKRELVFREDGQEYAQVTKMLGNGRLEAMCFDGEKRLAHIRGKMRKKVRTPSGQFRPVK